MKTIAAAPETSDIAFDWLLKLRWGAVVGQGVLFLGVGLVTGIDLPVTVIVAILLFAALSNVGFAILHRWRGCPECLFGVVILLDIVLLSVLLYSTGGPMNPFTFLYLVHIVLAAIILPPRWAWGLALAAFVCYGLIFVLPPSAACHSLGIGVNAGNLGGPIHTLIGQADENMRLHLYGMLLAFLVTSCFIVFFVSLIQKSLGRQQELLDTLKEERNRSEKLASLATLAAGAAHELSTPLAAIAVAAGEMHRTMQMEGSRQELLEDASFIRRQVETCKEVLFQLTADAGEPMGESMELFLLHDMLQKIKDDFEARHGAEIVLECPNKAMAVKLPPRTFRRIVTDLLKNGAEALPKKTPLHMSCGADHDFFHVTVQDRGTGMERECAAKAGQPFFTTKSNGRGMGLGLFLARTVAERFGGGLEMESVLGQGTTVTLRFARESVGAERK